LESSDSIDFLSSLHKRRFSGFEFSITFQYKHPLHYTSLVVRKQSFKILKFNLLGIRFWNVKTKTLTQRTSNEENCEDAFTQFIHTIFRPNVWQTLTVTVNNDDNVKKTFHSVTTDGIVSSIRYTKYYPGSFMMKIEEQKNKKRKESEKKQQQLSSVNSSNNVVNEFEDEKKLLEQHVKTLPTSKELMKQELKIFKQDVQLAKLSLLKCSNRFDPLSLCNDMDDLFEGKVFVGLDPGRDVLPLKLLKRIIYLQHIKKRRIIMM